MEVNGGILTFCQLVTTMLSTKLAMDLKIEWQLDEGTWKVGNSMSIHTLTGSEHILTHTPTSRPRHVHTQHTPPVSGNVSRWTTSWMATLSLPVDTFTMAYVWRFHSLFPSSDKNGVNECKLQIVFKIFCNVEATSFHLHPHTRKAESWEALAQS